MKPRLAPELRSLVHQAVAILGEVIEAELGPAGFRRIESLRVRMTRLRGARVSRSIRELRACHRDLERITPAQRLEVARAYALMLELMNACENAYRNCRIRRRRLELPRARPDSIVYVLTAHPTEARSPGNIWVFHQIQILLTRILEKSDVQSGEQADADLRELKEWLEIAWRTQSVRGTKPSVQDEAAHVYSALLNEETLSAFLRAGTTLAPVYARSWVGGDKDGHPGVDERVFLDSLQLSRSGLCGFIERRLDEIAQVGKVIASKPLAGLCRQASRNLAQLRVLRAGDLGRVRRFRSATHALISAYERQLRVSSSAIQQLQQLLKVFPALVVPIEFRENSDVLMSVTSPRGLAISRMLRALARLSREGDPRWYVRGFIISMTENIEHILRAAALVDRELNGLRIPVIPLFEQHSALDHAPRIVSEMVAIREIRDAIRDHWNNHLEVMLGYSDSSKEFGVLPSRLKIAQTMHALDPLIRSKGCTPIFFQGSGGSADRGGGTIADQTAGWSASALRNFKVTLQGEVVEHSLASPEIVRGQFERIIQSAGDWRLLAQRKLVEPPSLKAFSERVADHYRKKTRSPEFLELIERATPYPALDLLNIGSRPTKRSAKLSLAGLRAIPWVLCWTQTRVLFPTWWGVGSAWKDSNPTEREGLKRSMRRNPVFATFVRTLGFALTKVEFPVFRIYLENSGLSKPQVESTWDDFTNEYELASEFAHAMLGRNLFEWRPWLEESILLRSPMIHPLNLLQIIALRNSEDALLRLTLLGTSSGMMTTG